MHAFTFSPRPGTAAFDMKPHVPERVAVERAAVVQAIAERGRKAFAARRLGRSLEAVIEDHGEEGTDPLPGKDPGTVPATSADYLRLSVRGAPAGSAGACRCSVVSLAAARRSDGSPDLVADYISLI